MKHESEIKRRQNLASEEAVMNYKKVRHSIELLLNERDNLIETIKGLENLTSKAGTMFESMGGQAEMMMMLLRDLMDQAQLANNTFTMIREHFDCISLVKRCIKTLNLQA